MSRIGKQPVQLPSGVNVAINGSEVKVKGAKGELNLNLHPYITAEENDGVINVKPVKETTDHWAMCGTMRTLVNNMVIGVSEGFEKKLQLVGVGYRAQVQGNKLNLALGFSHPVEYAIPQGITIEAPSATELLVKGSDKQLVGEVAAKIRAYRPPEPYKGKGVRYADERVVMKEAKKK
ncbi:50S ribosomal protein L6 [Suttonella sp. R2A3]|uniref:50S ribosomal protein L6 n=1 Tax=Suttonella sp. R2A3 TaxID=2908648 RepID=UPI001F1C39E2|nr:50S ribosomal protein L6 [Suttonella sp. R2A3]UJF24232.1 50S ribosomal protein L6 [Suttonella sp. R2A3]